jgi:hypothetical protein
LPLTPGTIHNGGVVLIGPDNNVHTVVGEIGNSVRRLKTLKMGQILMDLAAYLGLLKMVNRSEKVFLGINFQ